jgi:hypothetical protein
MDVSIGGKTVKRFFETLKDARKAVREYERKTVMEPSKEELKVHKFGKGKRRYFVGSDADYFYKKVHGV